MTDHSASLTNPWRARFAELAPGVLTAFALAILAVMLRETSEISVLSPMLVAILGGIGVRLLLGPKAVLRPGLSFSARPVLRAGIVLLGLQVTLFDIVELGPEAFLVASLALVTTYVVVTEVGKRMGVPLPLSQLIAAGTAVCGASAVVAANSVARGNEEDVGYAVACITLFGTIAMLLLPLLAIGLGMSPREYGIWAGASIHEVAQVTAAAFQFGEEAGRDGIFTKLIRVMLLAPLVLGMAFATRGAAAGSGQKSGVAFPWFVLGFIALTVVNSLIDIGPGLRAAAGLVATVFMSAGLAAIGVALDLQQLKRRGLLPLGLGAFGMIFVLAFTYLTIKIVF